MFKLLEIGSYLEDESAKIEHIRGLKTIPQKMAGMTSKSGQTTSLKRKTPDAAVDETKASSSWTFLTNHVHVLAVLHSDPEKVLRKVGITEVAVLRITGHPEESGFIEWERAGRQNGCRILKCVKTL